MSCTTPVIFVVYKDKDSSLFYGLDWTDRLASGVTITASVWTVPAGLTNVTTQLATPITKVRIAGGTAGAVYDVVNTATYSTGEIDEQTIRFIIKER